LQRLVRGKKRAGKLSGWRIERHWLTAGLAEFCLGCIRFLFDEQAVYCLAELSVSRVRTK
jgi:hypothetical protein